MSAEPRLEGCYRSASAERPFGGHLRLQVVVDGEGRTESVTTNSVGPQSFRDCVEGVVRGLKYPRPAAVGALVIVSVKLIPGN